MDKQRQERCKLQLDPMDDYGDDEPPLPSPLSNPITDAENPISADGIGLCNLTNISVATASPATACG